MIFNFFYKFCNGGNSNGVVTRRGASIKRLQPARAFAKECRYMEVEHISSAIPRRILLLLLLLLLLLRRRR
jgi:hypothetical protein